jgi:hypothetical protein
MFHNISQKVWRSLRGSLESQMSGSDPQMALGRRDLKTFWRHEDFPDLQGKGVTNGKLEGKTWICCYYKYIYSIL